MENKKALHKITVEGADYQTHSKETYDFLLVGVGVNQEEMVAEMQTNTRKDLLNLLSIAIVMALDCCQQWGLSDDEAKAFFTESGAKASVMWEKHKKEEGQIC